MSNQVGEKPPKSKVARWLELTSLGVICTFGGLFVYHYTQASAQSSPTERKVDPTPIVINTAVSEDAKRQIMTNLPTKSKEKTLDVKPISLTDDETEPTINDSSTALLPEESVENVETPDSKSVAPVVPVKPTNPIEVISDPKQFASDQKKINQKRKKPSVVAILQEKHRKQKEQKEKQRKQKPERVSISVAKRPQQTQTKKPTTSQKATIANTKVPIKAKPKPVTITKPKTNTKPATTTKPKTTTPKPATTTKPKTSKPKTSTTKPKTTTPKKPAKKKAPYAVQKKFPGRNYFKSGAKNKYVTQLGHMLVAAGYGKYYKVGPGPQWTSADKNACRAFQKKQGWTGSDADGYPGPETWNRLYKKYYTKYSR